MPANDVHTRGQPQRLSSSKCIGEITVKKQWFDVDKVGLGKQAEQHHKGRLVGELIQNALDEVGVTRIDIRLTPVSGRPLVDLTVEDDSPEGFRDLAHAYTL